MPSLRPLRTNCSATFQGSTSYVATVLRIGYYLKLRFTLPDSTAQPLDSTIRWWDADDGSLPSLVDTRSVGILVALIPNWNGNVFLLLTTECVVVLVPPSGIPATTLKDDTLCVRINFFWCFLYHYVCDYDVKNLPPGALQYITRPTPASFSHSLSPLCSAFICKYPSTPDHPSKPVDIAWHPAIPDAFVILC